MREFDGAKLAEFKDKWRELDERATKYGGFKIYTRGNFLRSMGYSMTDLAFHYRMTQTESSGNAMRKPAVAAVIGLKSSCDFENPDAITATPASPVEGMIPLDAFRFIVANHRYVYHFDTWPQAAPDLGANTSNFAPDWRNFIPPRLAMLSSS